MNANHDNRTVVNANQIAGPGSNPIQRKRKYKKHTSAQIQAMEESFRVDPHPKHCDRKKLANRLGLEPRQVKFWFQNKRTQLKVQKEHAQLTHLQSENRRLQSENSEWREAVRNGLCSTCGGPCNISSEELKLLLEKAGLREKFDQIVETSPRTQHKMEIGSTSRSSVSTERQKISSVVEAAIEELTTMAEMAEPMWNPNPNCNGDHVLNEVYYLRRFSKSGVRPLSAGFIRQASRHVSTVPMDPIHLVEMFMDTAKWSEMFSGLVSSAISAGRISEDVPENLDRSLKVIIAELQVLSPFMPVRREIFNRYCKQHKSGAWVVVDFSTENLLATPPINIWKRPSGCLIEKSDGGSKVTWVEHVETAQEDRGTSVSFEKLLQSELAFGAKRWISTLARGCERKASLSTLPILSTLSPEGKRSMMKVAERMMNSFYGGMQPSSGQKWRIVAGIIGEGRVQVMTCHNTIDRGCPAGLLLTAATSFRLPFPPSRVFRFLYRTQYQNQFNILSSMTAARASVTIATGKRYGSSITLLEGRSSDGNKTWTLQESRVEKTGWQLVYAVVDDKTMEKVRSGEDSQNVPLLPSGFAILPYGQLESINGALESAGSILTVSLQLVAAATPNGELMPGSIESVSSFMTKIIQRIKDNIDSNYP